MEDKKKDFSIIKSLLSENERIIWQKQYPNEVLQANKRREIVGYTVFFSFLFFNIIIFAIIFFL